MWIEYISYTATFIISVGMATLGILATYNSFQQLKLPVLAILLYQQIFLFSFFIYGIWGNMALREILADLNLSAQLNAKLAFFIPIIGIPFMIVSWFMLLKFGFNANGYKFSKVFIYTYFPTLVLIVFLLSFLIQNETLKILPHPDLFVVRTIATLNLVMHLFFILPFFLKLKKDNFIKQIGLSKKWILIYFAGVLIYSAALSFFNAYGFISICFSIVLLFAVSSIIPIKIKAFLMTAEIMEDHQNFDFESFCNAFEISKRESEIILEICSGKSNKAIAEKLFITLQTVKDHTHRIYTKTGVKSRVQLANLVNEKTGQN